jgi:hypothetical protein
MIDRPVVPSANDRRVTHSQLAAPMAQNQQSVRVFDPSADETTGDQVEQGDAVKDNHDEDVLHHMDEPAVWERHSRSHDDDLRHPGTNEDEGDVGLGRHHESALSGFSSHDDDDDDHPGDAATEVTTEEDKEESPAVAAEPEADHRQLSINVHSNAAPTKSTVDHPVVGDGYEPPQPMETPNRPIRPSRFVFLSDQKSVPTDMKKLQERTIKRRRELLAKMHDADCHMASLLAKYAEEKMDMDLAVHDTFERSVANPLLSSMDRLALHRDASRNMNGVTNLERRVNHLDASMMHHVNVTMSDIQRDELESFHDDLQQDIMSEIRVETSTYDKVEGEIVRRFEQVAGEIARDFHGEGAARRAEMELIKYKVERTIPEQSERLEDALSKIANLRAQLRQERADRQAADQAVLESIVSNTAAMKRAMMALVSDGELG